MDGFHPKKQRVISKGCLCISVRKTWLHKANEAKFPMETWFPKASGPKFPREIWLPKANGPKFFYTNMVSTCSPKFLKACSPENFKPICKIPKENNGFQFPFSLENLTYFSRRRPWMLSKNIGWQWCHVNSIVPTPSKRCYDIHIHKDIPWELSQVALKFHKVLSIFNFCGILSPKDLHLRISKFCQCCPIASSLCGGSMKGFIGKL